MRKLYRPEALLTLAISISLWSCRSTNYLTLNVVEPAPVFLSPDVKTVGIIDRSLPDKKNERADKVDKILSAEGMNLDKEGARKSVDGLADELTSSDRFVNVKIIEAPDVRSAGLGVFPSALSWGTIDRLCRENKVDAIFALSFYDTEATIDYQANSTEVSAPLGVKIPAIEHVATISTLIKTGWRIYDPTQKRILDEYWMNEQSVSTGRGINPVKAAEAIIGRKEAVLDISNAIGHRYASRIFDYSLRVSRDYYVRGTDNFKIAKRRAQTGDWEGATELWKKDIRNSKRKVAGRACYNMAISNEIFGDLNAAVEWATKSYADYNDKLALGYLNVLKDRIAKKEMLGQ